MAKTFRAALKGGTSVPVPFVIVLCCLTYFWGRFMQSDVLPDVRPQVGIPNRRNLKTEAQDPLAGAQLEKYMIESGGLPSFRPPLPPGLTGEPFYHSIPFQVLSWHPRLLLFPAFLTKAQCEHIVQLAKTKLARSQLLYKPGDNTADFTDTRTSEGTFLSYDQDPEGVLAEIENRIAVATHIPVENGEPFNVLRYQLTQHYDSHLDAWDPALYGAQPDGQQRVATFIMYLTDVEEGGGTVFKKEGTGNASRVVHDMRSCDDGSYQVHPRQGDAILFYSLTTDAEVDQQSMHGGCPVVKGEKWAMTKWLRNKPFGYRTAESIGVPVPVPVPVQSYVQSA